MPQNEHNTVIHLIYASSNWTTFGSDNEFPPVLYWYEKTVI